MLEQFRALLLVSLFLLAPIDASAAAFSDDFDAPGWTELHWDIGLGTWNHVVINGLDFGYHTIATSVEPSVSFSDNGAYYNQANLTVELELRLDGPEADQLNSGAGLIFISGSIAQGQYVEYTVLLQIDYDETPTQRSLCVWNYSTDSGDAWEIGCVMLEQSQFSSDVFYRLRVITNPLGHINVELRSDTGSMIDDSLKGLTLVTPYESGMVGILATQDPSNEVTFNNFNSVPEPGRLLMLTAGAGALVVLRRVSRRG